MNAYCPKCETELDQNTGICPACRWDPTAISLSVQPSSDVRELSISERYRGTQYDVSLQQAAFDGSAGFSRGRAFILVGLVAAVALYGTAMGAMGIF